MKESVTREQVQQVHRDLEEVRRSLKALDVELTEIKRALVLDDQNASLLQQHNDLLQKRAQLDEDKNRLLDMQLHHKQLLGDRSWPYNLYKQGCW